VRNGTTVVGDRIRVLTTAGLAEFRGDFGALLAEECQHWLQELHWDFHEVSAAVTSGLARGSLSGRVSYVGRRPLAYCYYLEDEGRILLGSLFASAPERGRGLEEDLLGEVLAEVQGLGRPSRIECQTLFSTARDADRTFARQGFAGGARLYMQAELERPVRRAERRWTGPGRCRAVTRSDLTALAQLIHQSHVGSLDAALNLTYSSVSHCRQFIETLVVRAGCGPFDTEASCVVEVDGRAIGVLLASRLSQGNGHVCQVSVAAEWQGRGLGRLLVERSLRAFAAAGLERASLSVTLANRRALKLYEQLGFRTRRSFAAHAWLRPPARLELPA